jgi:hypothetical protein
MYTPVVLSDRYHASFLSHAHSAHFTAQCLHDTLCFQLCIYKQYRGAFSLDGERVEYGTIQQVLFQLLLQQPLFYNLYTSMCTHHLVTHVSRMCALVCVGPTLHNAATYHYTLAYLQIHAISEHSARSHWKFYRSHARTAFEQCADDSDLRTQCQADTLLNVHVMYL